ncbi:MAG: DUF58 domain-containing protein [Microscillaceae bacterium]|nr:DUF58 domain-containing protein [Microscillaceae bacterium]
MNRLYRNVYLPIRFFGVWSGIIILFIFGFFWAVLMPLAQTLLVLFGVLLIADTVLIFGKQVKFDAQRITPAILSLGNEQTVQLKLQNLSGIPVWVSVIDELPFQMQKRDFLVSFPLKAQEEKEFSYPFRPLSRGVYNFGKINLYLRSSLGLIERRVQIKADAEVAVYPSILDMKKFELASVSQRSQSLGLKKIRRIGHSSEFEQIKEYALGDDFQSINWKATGRMNRLMINSYTDERAQQVYCILDKSRSMKMPFHGLSLMDYSINSCLIIANTSLRKQDKAGLITFAEKIDSIVKADRHKNQLQAILDTLYKEKETTLEANYEMLYQRLRKVITSRSLIFLYTNFESKYALERVLPILRKINKQHLLVLVIFENTELIHYAEETAKTLEEIYLRTIAKKFAYERYQILYELDKYGIQSIFTKPENLSINAINKYLELKSRGMI